MRYIPLTPDDREAMLHDIGVSSFTELLRQIPTDLQLKGSLKLPSGKSEAEVARIITAMARNNLQADDLTSYLGAGSYDHFIPAAVSALASRSEFLTAYTPYQPEVSQGTLQVIYEFQSMICELFAMDAANASIYDGGTALTEAVLLACAQTGRKQIIWPDSIHPHYRKVTQTITGPTGSQFALLPMNNGCIEKDRLNKALSPDAAAVVLQYPNFFGLIENLEPFIKTIHDAGALAIIVTDPLAMGVLTPPGEWNADIVVGEGQSLGNPQSFGGPYLGLFAVKEKLVRRMPGRIVGITRDVDGRRGFVLTLQTREQHIRREKATSNICTNEGLCAARAAFYLSLLGPKGLRDVGKACLASCEYLRRKLADIPGVEITFNGMHFKEFAINLKGDIPKFLEFMAKRSILAGIPLKRFNIGMDNSLLIAVTERRTQAQLDEYVNGVRAFMGEKR